MSTVHVEPPAPRPAFVPAGREYVTLTEIAGWTGQDISTLRRHAAKGALVTVRIGGRRMVTIAALRDYLGC